jgi:uncharacterized BrkB/YihY/UPF0761 family membrane protein
VYHSFATYLIAIAVTAFADYLVTPRETENRTLTLALFGLALVAGLASVIILVVPREDVVNLWAKIGALCAALLWLVINDENRNLVESNALSPLGGNAR